MNVLTKDVHELKALFETLTMKVSMISDSIDSIKGDKAHFMSDAMDRIRALERAKGNNPSLSIPANSIAPITTGESVTPTSASSSRLSKEDILARARARRA